MVLRYSSVSMFREAVLKLDGISRLHDFPNGTVVVQETVLGKLLRDRAALLDSPARRSLRNARWIATQSKPRAVEVTVLHCDCGSA